MGARRGGRTGSATLPTGATLRQLRRDNRALDALNRCLAVRLWDCSLRLKLTLDHLAGLRKAVTSAYANPADSTRCALIIAEAVLAREAEFLAAWKQTEARR